MFKKVVSYVAVDGTSHKTEDEAGRRCIDVLLSYSDKGSGDQLIEELKILAKNQDVMDWLIDYIKK